jgi:predicted  nucleic acid-binding Zn-ribbon protein
LEEIKVKMADLEADLDYFKTKSEKMEVENGQLRVKQSDNKRIRELENEVEILKDQASKQGSSGPVAPTQSIPA